MKKTIVILIAALAAALLIISGCGEKKVTTTKNTISSQQSQTGTGKTTEDTAVENDAWDGKIESLLAKAKGLEGMRYDFVFETSGMTTTGKVWMQGTNMVRTESEFEGTNGVIIIDGVNKFVYTFEKDGDSATKVVLSDKTGEQKTAVDYVNMIKTDMVTSTQETSIDGIPAVLVTYNIEGQDAPIKAWLRKDNGLPVKVESTMPNGTAVVMTYSNLETGPVSDDFFKLPEGMKVNTIDPNAMLKNMPKMPQGMPKP